MEKKFTRDDISVGYAVKLRDGSYRIACVVNKGSMILLSPEGTTWDYLSKWDLKTLKYHTCDKTGRLVAESPNDIMTVYGLVRDTDMYKYVMSIGFMCSLSSRPILWEGKTVKKMTVAEIEAALGYAVEIVSEGE
jgi:hypothetical protein